MDSSDLMSSVDSLSHLSESIDNDDQDESEVLTVSSNFSLLTLVDILGREYGSYPRSQYSENS